MGDNHHGLQPGSGALPLRPHVKAVHATSAYARTQPRQHPEGSSLRKLVASAVFTRPEHSTERYGRMHDAWEIYFDTATGHPYYYSRHTGVTQWENPFNTAYTVAVDGGSGGTTATPRSAADYESWRLYETFHMESVLDALPGIVNARATTPRGTCCCVVAVLVASHKAPLAPPPTMRDRPSRGCGCCH